MRTGKKKLDVAICLYGDGTKRLVIKELFKTKNDNDLLDEIDTHDFNAIEIRLSNMKQFIKFKE